MKKNSKSGKNILMWVLLVLLPPVGIIYVWVAKKEFTTKKKAILSAIFAVWFIVVLLIPEATPEGKQAQREAAKQEIEKTEEENEADKLGVDVEFIKNIKDACESVGMDIDDIEISSAENDGSTCKAQVEYEGYIFDVSGDADNTVTYIGSGNIPFLQNGQIQDVNTRIVTQTQKSILIVQAESDVKENLKAPSTAEFPGHVLEADEWVVNKNGDIFSVSSWVDAQNSFGAQIRNTFFITYKWDGNENTTPELTGITIE